MTEDLKTSGTAIQEMLDAVDIDQQLMHLKKDILSTKSASKRDIMVRQIKYLAGLKKNGGKPADSFVLHNIPVIPPMARPPITQAGNRIEYPDVNQLYRDHILTSQLLGNLGEESDWNNDILQEQREAAYNGVKALFGLGTALKGSARGAQLRGFLQQIAGENGPKGGFFQSKILKKKQDFSARATIYAEPNLGFNEMAVPVDMLWTMYKMHIIRDLARNGYSYPDAKKAVESRNGAAQASFNKLIKQIPIIANRAPTLMQSNITAHFPVPVQGKTLGVNPLHLPLYAGDFDGDAMTIHTPITPEAIEEAKKKLLPEQHAFDYRKGIGASLVAPGHEAILGSMDLTDPDMTQKPQEFDSEEAVLKALEAGTIKHNTPIKLREH